MLFADEYLFFFAQEHHNNTASKKKVFKNVSALLFVWTSFLLNRLSETLCYGEKTIMIHTF